MNNAREFAVGPYLVDGFDSNMRTIYEFLSDWFHRNLKIDVREQYMKQKKHRYSRIWIDSLSFIGEVIQLYLGKRLSGNDQG